MAALSCLPPASFIPGLGSVLPSSTKGGSPVRESRPPGSVRGVPGDGRPYRDKNYWCCLLVVQPVKCSAKKGPESSSRRPDPFDMNKRFTSDVGPCLMLV